jgi:hypothetical protein
MGGDLRGLLRRFLDEVGVDVRGTNLDDGSAVVADADDDVDLVDRRGGGRRRWGGRGVVVSVRDPSSAQLVGISDPNPRAFALPTTNLRILLWSAPPRPTARIALRRSDFVAIGYETVPSSLVNAWPFPAIVFNWAALYFSKIGFGRSATSSNSVRASGSGVMVASADSSITSRPSLRDTTDSNATVFTCAPSTPGVAVKSIASISRSSPDSTMSAPCRCRSTGPTQ